jgi:hypothetical protein
VVLEISDLATYQRGKRGETNPKITDRMKEKFEPTCSVSFNSNTHRYYDYCNIIN